MLRQDFQCRITQELCIARSIDDTHAALTKLRRDFIRADTCTWCDCHTARDYNECGRGLIVGKTRRISLSLPFPVHTGGENLGITEGGTLTRFFRRLQMTKEQIEVVQNTFNKVRPMSGTAAQLFYNRLFDVDPSVRETLLWTLKQGLGADFTPEAEVAWGNAYDFLAAVMQQAAKGASM